MDFIGGRVFGRLAHALILDSTVTKVPSNSSPHSTLSGNWTRSTLVFMCYSLYSFTIFDFPRLTYRVNMKTLATLASVSFRLAVPFKLLVDVVVCFGIAVTPFIRRLGHCADDANNKICPQRR